MGMSNEDWEHACVEEGLYGLLWKRQDIARSWKTSLHPLLKQLTNKSAKSPRIAILGVGNQFRSDDAAGVLIADALSNREWQKTLSIY